MRINFSYSVAMAMMAGAFGLLGPVAAQAGQIPGASVPACAGACGLKAPAAPAVHLSRIARAPIALTSMIKRSSDSKGYGRERFGLPGQRDRMLQRSDRCGWWDGQWRYGDFDHHHHHHHRHHHHYGDFDGYGHYRHHHHYGDFDGYGHYRHHHHYGDYYGHYGHHHGDFDHYRHYR